MTVENLRFPVGRIVAGNPAKFEDRVDFYTKKPVLKDGMPVKQCWFNVAIPKDKFMAEVWPRLAQEAATVNPAATQIHPDQYENQRFAFKVINGDSPACPQGSNVPYNKREGFPGNYIIRFSSSAFAPGIFKYENGAYRKLTENEIKCGDFVVVNANITAHREKDGGIYWNPNGIELVGYGTEISGSGAADPTAMFGGQTYQLPPGASATPLSSAPVGATMPTMPAAPAPVAQPTMPTMPTMPAAPSMPSMPTMPTMPAPAYDFVQNAGQQTPFAPSAVAPQQPAPQTVGGIAMPVTTFPGR